MAVDQHIERKPSWHNEYRTGNAEPQFGISAHTTRAQRGSSECVSQQRPSKRDYLTGNAEPQLGISAHTTRVQRGSSECVSQQRPSKRDYLTGNAEPQLGIDNYQTKPELGTSGSAVGWHSRGYLPHFDTPSVLQSMTFRLADSLPQEKLRELERELAVKPDTERDAARRRTIETWLDAGIGCCALRHPELAMLMQETLLKFDGNRYRLLAWCVMPNHVHVLIEPITSLSKIVQSWKSFTGRWALAHNTTLGLGVPGKQLWMRDYWDRYIRHQQHLDAVVAYIHNNPVAAGLCGRPQVWPWSSAGCFRSRAQGLSSD